MVVLSSTALYLLEPRTSFHGLVWSVFVIDACSMLVVIVSFALHT